MNIALVFPRTKYPSGDIPLGVAYLASYLRANTGCKVTIVDTTFHSDYESYLKNIFSRREFDLVGISAMTTMIDAAYLTANIVKSANPKARVVLGGPHVTMMPEVSLANKNIDAVVIGEGEDTLLELAKNMDDPKNVAGIWYKENGSIKKNPQRQAIEDLDSILYPAWDLLEMRRYSNSWFQLDSLSQDIKGTSIICSRGCPYHCSYCQPTLNALFGTRIRKRSAANIAGELKSLRDGYGINGFNFVDDTFVVDKDWVLSVCREIIKEELDIKWLCNFRANLVSEDLLKEMKKAGLVKVNIGIESGSQRILDDVYKKGITLSDVKRGVTIAKDLGLKVQGYFMLGAPSETEEEIKETIRLAERLPINEATFSITTPLPGTHLYHNNRHVIDNQALRKLDYYKKSIFTNGAISPKRIAALKRIAIFKFYLGRERILGTIKLLLSFQKLGKTILKLKRL